MTYLLNISFMTHKSIEDQVMTWLNKEFVPVVTDPAIGFDKFEAFKVISPLDHDNQTICFQMRSPNRKKLQNWFDVGAAPVCQELCQRFVDAEGNSQVIVFPTVMEGIE